MREKKEPEVEWLYDCFQKSSINVAIQSELIEKEDDAKQFVEGMAKKYPGETFAYIPVCRIKAVE